MNFFTNIEDMFAALEGGPPGPGNPVGGFHKACGPHDPPEAAHHKHGCPSCGTTWQHHNDWAWSGWSSEEFHDAHSCPNCGQGGCVVKV